MKIKASDRVKELQPQFIQEDYKEFYTLLEEYYKSQEKTGRPYDIANNLTDYFDIDKYNSVTLTDSTVLLSDVGYYDTNIPVESVLGFRDKDGSFLVDKEVVYYDSITTSPNIILVPGVSSQEFESRYQTIESILPYLVPSGSPAVMGNTYPLKIAGIPISPLDEDHLVVSLYGKILRPHVDYVIDNTDIIFTETPREKTQLDGDGNTYIKYFLGFASNRITELSQITTVSNKKIYSAILNGSTYTLRSEILSIVTLDKTLLTPYQDYSFNSSNEIILKSVPAAGKILSIRSIEFTTKSIGSDAFAVSKVENGKLVDIIVKNYGTGYNLNFIPRVLIASEIGKDASAISLVNGIKSINLLTQGSGYNSLNPPKVVFDLPPENGTIPVAEVSVDPISGQINNINLINSGSGYITPPRIKFLNPGGAEISHIAEIDSDGKIIESSIQIIKSGEGYSTAPQIYIDSPTAEGSNPAVIKAIITNSGVSGFQILSRGNGYTTPPKLRIIQPVGAQILNVIINNGSVINIDLLSGGFGYIDPPSVYIIDNRKDIDGVPYGGTGAAASATIFNGSITDITITSFGTGYSSTEPPTVFISPPPDAKASVDIGIGEVTGFTIINEGSEYESSSFVGCSRGVSGVVGFNNDSEQIFSSELTSRSRQHAMGSSVINLDSLFLLQIFKRFTQQYLPNIQVDYTKLNASQIVKTIKDFYLSKGTKNALTYIFKILYGENVDVLYPKDQIFTPSAATWAVDTILRCKLISGNPKDIINTILYQYKDPVDLSVEFASALVENLISIYIGNSQIYEVSISKETQIGSFNIPYKTKLVERISSTDNIITVDSTLGWPEKNGTILLGVDGIDEIEYVQYKEKTLNQFLECTRSKNSIVQDWDAGTGAGSDIFVFSNFGLDNEVKLQVVGIAEAATTELIDSGSYYLPGDKLTITKLGATSENNKITNWLYNVKKLVKIETITPGGINNKTATVYCNNPHGLLVGDQVTIYGANPIVYNGSFEVSSRISSTVFSYVLPQPAEFPPQGNVLISIDLNKGKSDEYAINNSITKFTTNIQNTFFNTNYAYVASTGIPNYKIGPFIGSALIPGNQRKLNRFPINSTTTSVRKEILAGPIATWINGVSAWSYKDVSYITYGGVTSVEISNGGINYDASSPPVMTFSGGGGTGAAAEVVVNGSITAFEILTNGDEYSETPLVSIVGGGGSGATAKAIITNKKVTQILVETPGNGYTYEPIITISGGGGSGATARADVRGPIQIVKLLSGGSNYTSTPKATLSSGSGAEAQPIIINGRIVSIAVISAGNGYTTAPNVYINGDGFGAKAKAIIGTFGEDLGKVVGIQILNRGIGYTQGYTTIRLESIGEQAVFKTNVFNWYFNLESKLASKYDSSRGYVFAGYNTQYGGEYAHVSNPQTLRYVLGDNVFKNAQQVIQENEGTFLHSPILGWAFDGNPIYGPYGYTDPTDSSKGVRRIRTSYALKSNIVYNIDTNPTPQRIGGPPLSGYPAGTFVNDYYYNFGSGDLDEYNGRFCKTPEYPSGTYAYFTTIDASSNGNPLFPYIIGPQYYSSPDEWNLSQNAVQLKIPTDVVRYRDPFENVDIDTERQPNSRTDFITTEDGDVLIFDIQDSNNDGIISSDENTEILELTEEQSLELFDYFPQINIDSKVDIEVETTTKFESAQISGFVIENPGDNYKVNDKITFDNTDTDGFGASAKIETIQGSKILNYNTTYVGDDVVATITTETNHGLTIGDSIIIDTEPALDTNFKNFTVQLVAGIENISIVQEGVGYSPDIPPEYELITSQGQDALLNLNLQSQGTIKSVDIINSGNSYSVQSPPQIRITHPQIFKKANYFVTEFDEASGRVEWFDSHVTEDRSVYACGRVVQGTDTLAILAKFNNDGRLLWKRTIIPSYPSAAAKNAVWKRLVVQEASPHIIYVIGETIQNTTNVTYNPDILVAKYISGFNTQNQPDGIIQWQKEFGGISGPTRRDYATAIDWSYDLQVLVIGGYTDTNTVSSNDMWFIILNTLGDVVEKRKITSDSEDEKLTDISIVGSSIYFTGIIQSKDIIYGELEFDLVNINLVWARRLPSPVNYKFTNSKIKIDEYNSMYLVATESNDSTSQNEKVTLCRIDLNSYFTLVWAKRISPTATTFTSINNLGVHIDVFNNINIGISVIGSTSYFDVVKFKHTGSIIKDSRIVVGTSWIGSTFVIDNSADIFAFGTTSNNYGAILKLDNNHTKLGAYTTTGMVGISGATVTDITYSIDEDYSPTTMSNFNAGSPGYQLLDFSDSISSHLPGVYTFISNTYNYSSRTATVPAPTGKTLKVQTNVIKKYYLRDSLATKVDNIKKISFNQTANFKIGSLLQWYTIQGSGENAQEVVSAYGSIVSKDDNYVTIGKIYGILNNTSRLKDDNATINEFSQTFLDVAYFGTLGTFRFDLATYTSTIPSGTAEFKVFNPDDYVLKIVGTVPGSSFLPGDIVSIGYNGVSISFDSSYQVATITGLTAVNKVTLISNLRKIVKATTIERTNEAYVVTNRSHNYSNNDIIYIEGFTYNDYNGSFFVKKKINNREYTYGLRSIPVVDPITSTSISAVKIFAKHPSLVFVKGHQYIFDVGNASNSGYYLSFSKDNQYKLEYSFNNITRNGNPGIDPPGVIPYVRFKTIGDVTNISYYFDPSHIGNDSPVGINSFIDVVDTPYKGKFRITATPSSTQFKFLLEREPEGPVILDSTKYSTTSTRALGPISSIKLVNKGGFYKKLPIVTSISSNRQIESIIIENGGTEYAVGVYRDIPISGNGEGGKVNITVELGGDPVTGTITQVDLIDSGKGYTTGYIDIEAITGILGSNLAGSGAILNVNIPPQGSGASVFLQGTQVGKIKRLKNNNFGYDYPHDYTLKPEIKFPVNLQLFNTSVLTSIKVTDPGAGYTTAPAVIITGGGGTGAIAVAIVKNNRLQDIIVKEPGSGYSSKPSVILKSEFNYVVNVDLGYFQFNFPHGIGTASEVTLRADDLGSTIGQLPQPSSAGLTSLVEGQIYYTIAGQLNGLEDNQIRIALTYQDALNGQFITFLNNGAGKQILLTEVFGGKAEGIVETSRFLEGEEVYQGTDPKSPTAIGTVSANDGWQIGPRILKVIDYTGSWIPGQKITGLISKAGGTIDNINNAIGVLNIGSITETPGKFLDNIGKPSEIVQKLQDSYFYQNFSYIINSNIPINQWRNTIRKVNHPAGFNLFGQLNLTGGRDVSGRKVSTSFTKRVDISEFTQFSQIINFASAQPIYSEFNNTEVLFRNKKLTSSEEILTSVVKKIDDISSQFDGVKKSFPLKINGEQVIASTGQVMILINGVLQAPDISFSILNGNIEFTEAPKPSASITYRDLEFTPVPVKRITLSNISGILPEINQQIRGLINNGTATVVRNSTGYLDVINVIGSFSINEPIVASATGLSAIIQSINTIVQGTIFRFGEQISNLTKNIAIIEEINLASTLPKYPSQVSAWNNLTAQTAHRFVDGANLIVANRTYIIETAFSEMQSNFPAFIVPGGAGANDKCKRDIGYILDALVKDLKGGGNSNIISAISTYFSNGVPISNGLVGEEVQSIYAFEKLRDLCKLAVTNNLPIKDVTILTDNVISTNGGANPNTNTNLNPNNCSDVRSAINTLIAMVTLPLQTGSLGGLPSSNPGSWNIGSFTNKIIVSKTLGTSKYETGLFNLSINDYFISAETGIVGKITKLSSYRDPSTNQVVGSLEINKGSFFFGMIFERLTLPTNPNTIVDDISKTVIRPTKIDNQNIYVNQNYPLSEYAQNINLRYDNSSGSWVAGDYIRNTKLSFANAVGNFTQGESIRSRKIIYKNKSKGTFFPDFTVKGLTSGATASIIGVNTANSYLYIKPPTGTFSSNEIISNWDITNTGSPKVRLASSPNFRYLDAADRIVANTDLIKEEIIGYISSKYPDFYYPNSPSISYRYKDARNLIYANLDYIVTTSYNAIATQYPSFTNPNPTKCQRDIRYIVMAIANDLYDGGNKWTRIATLLYFNGNVPLSNGLVGEEVQAVYAFNFAKNLCKQAITNQLANKDLTITADANPSSGTSSNTNANSCSNVQSTLDTLFSILTTAITAGNITSIPSLSTGEFSIGENTCKRDIGHIIDAIVFDLQYGGNSAITSAGDYYIDGNGNLLHINGEETQSRAAWKYARDLMIAAMRNFTVTLPSTVRTASSTNLTVTSTVGLVEGMDITGTGFNSNTKIVSITNDTTLVMNQAPSGAGTSNAVFTLNYAKYTTLSPINDSSLTIDASNPTCANVASSINTLWTILDTIISTKVVPAITYPTYSNKFGKSSAGFGVSNAGLNNIKINNPEKLALTLSDFTIDMWVYKTTNATTQYLLDMRDGNTAQVVPTLYFNTLNQVIYFTNGSTRITTTAVVPINTWTHIALVRKSGVTKIYINGTQSGSSYTDTNNYIGKPLRIGSSYQDNSGFRGLMDDFRMSNISRYDGNFTVPSTPFSDDSADILAFHFNGSNGVTDIYPENYVTATYDSARTSSAIIGQINSIDKILTVEAIDASRQEYKDATDYIIKNKQFIIKEMIGYLKNKYPLLVMPGDTSVGSDGTNFCERDTGIIVDSICKDLISGGNYNTVYTAKYYLEKSGALKFISGELLQSVYSYQKVGEIINQILLGTIVKTYSEVNFIPVPSPFNTSITLEVTGLCDIITDILAPTGDRFRDAANLLYFNKQYIAEEVAESIESFFKWTNVSTNITYDLFTNPNTTKCIRDLKDHLIPAMITDLLTGGNNATIEAFNYYIDSNTKILFVENELLAMYKALELAKPLAQKAVNNLLYGKNSINTPSGAYIALYTTKSAYRDLTITADSITGSNQNTASCSNVTAAISTLFDLLLNIISEESTLYAATSRRSAAKLLLFNKSYIINEAYNTTKTAYPLYPGVVGFGTTIIDNIIYDIITDGNARSFATALSWLDAFYNFIAFSGYNPIQLIYHLEQLRIWSNKALTQTLNLVGPTTNQPRYSESGLVASALTAYVDTLINFYKNVINTPSSITSTIRDPGINIPSINYGTRVIPVPYTLSMEPSSVFYGETSTAYAEVSSLMQNKYKIRTPYTRLNINLNGTVVFIPNENITATGGITALVHQTDGSTYIDVTNITGGSITVSTVLTGSISLATATVTSIENRLMLQQIMGNFENDEFIYSLNSNSSAEIVQWNYNSGVIYDNTSGNLSLDTETLSGIFRKNELIYSSESDYLLNCFAIEGLKIPSIGDYVSSTSTTELQINTGSIQTSGNTTDKFVQGDTLYVILNNLPTSQYATIISYDEITGIMFVGNKTTNFNSFAIASGYTVGVFNQGTLQPKIFASVSNVMEMPCPASGKITRIEQSGNSIKIWIGEIVGTFISNAQIIGSYNFKTIILTSVEVVSRVSRYSRGFDGSTTSFKLTSSNGAPYTPDVDGHVLVFVNGILQPPGADNAYTVFSDNIQFTEAPSSGASFNAYYIGKLRLLDDISFDFDSLRSSFNLKLNNVFYSLTVTSGIQSNTILPENNIIVAINGVLQEPGIGFKLVGSRITFSEIPRAGSSFVAFSYIGSDADVIAATVVPPVEIGDGLFIEGEEYDREVAVIESSNSLITYEYSGSVKGRNGAGVARITSGRIDTALVTAPGSGYTSRPSVEVLSPSGFDGQILAKVGIYRIDISNPGSGYSEPSVIVDANYGSVTGFTKINNSNSWTDMLIAYTIPGTDIVISITWSSPGNPVITVVSSGDDHTLGESYSIPANLISHTTGVPAMIIQVSQIS